MEIKKIILLVLVMAVTFGAIPFLEKEFHGFYNYNVERFNGNMELKAVQLNHYRVSDFIEEVLSRNLLLNMQYSQYGLSNSDQEKFKTKYSPYIETSVGYKQSDLSNVSGAAMSGTDIKEYNLSYTYAQLLKGGTTFAAGFQNTMKNTQGVSPALVAFGLSGGVVHTPVLFIQMEQNLLKNAFGINDELTEGILSLNTLTTEELVKYDISRLIFSTLYDQYQLIKTYRDLCDEIIVEEFYMKIREAVSKNIEFGTMEDYTLNQFNALIYSTQVQRFADERNYKKLINKNASNLRLRSDIKRSIPLIPLITTASELRLETLLEKAYNRRADYLKVKNTIAILEKKLQIVKNELLPDLKMSLSYSLIGDSDNWLDAAKEIAKLENSNTELKFTFSQLLENRDSQIKIRDIELQLKQTRLYEQQLRQEIKDEIIDSIETQKMIYESYVLLVKAQQEAELYVDRLQLRLTQAKVSTVELKSAIDMWIGFRKAKSELLIAYNIAQINLKVQTNTLFDDFNINLNKYLDVARGGK